MLNLFHWRSISLCRTELIHSQSAHSVLPDLDLHCSQKDGQAYVSRGSFNTNAFKSIKHYLYLTFDKEIHLKLTSPLLISLKCHFIGTDLTLYQKTSF